MKKNICSYTPTFDYELLHAKEGVVAGVDEAGRGSLAGPLYVALVVFPSEFYKNTPDEIIPINDSKKLTLKKREELYLLIQRTALLCDSIAISAEEIDQCNINIATHRAIERLLDRLSCNVDAALVDGNFSFQSEYNLQSIKKGDSLSFSIAAASIVAKVERDRVMCDYAVQYPEYLFEKNMGYGTKAHRAAIVECGGSPIHRKSYEPLKSLLNES